MLIAGQLVTSVAEEKKFNTRLTKPLDEFVNIMNNLNLPYPKFIGILFWNFEFCVFVRCARCVAIFSCIIYFSGAQTVKSACSRNVEMR